MCNARLPDLQAGIKLAGRNLNKLKYTDDTTLMGWMASPTQWAWVWASFGSWWWVEKSGVLQSAESQRVRHDSVAELNWTAESKEELKNLLKKVREESEKAGLKHDIQKPKIISAGPIISQQIGETMGTVTDFVFLGSKITVDCDRSLGIKHPCSLEEKLWQT